MAAGSIVIDLLMRTGAFETDTKRAEAALRRFNKAATEQLQAAGIAAAAYGAAFLYMSKDAIDAMDKMNDAAQKTGITTEALSQLGFAAKMSGVETDSFTSAMVKFNKAIAEGATGSGNAAAAFKAIGISASELKSASPDQVLAMVAEKFAGFADGANKTALAIAIFGRAGADLIPLLNEGADGIAEMRKEADALGATISGAAAKSADQFNDNLDKMIIKMKSFVKGVVSEVIPTMNILMETFLAGNSLMATIDAGMNLNLEGGATEVGAQLARAELQLREADEKDKARLKAKVDAYRSAYNAIRTMEGASAVVTAGTGKPNAPSLPDTAADKAGQNLLKGLQERITKAGEGEIAMLRLQAAEKGVSAAAEPLLQQLSSLKWNEGADKFAESLIAQTEALAFQTSLVGKSAKDVELLNAQYRIYAELQKQIQDLTRQNGTVSTEAVAEMTAAAEAQLAVQQQIIAARQAEQETIEFGVNKALNSYIENAGNAAKTVEGYITGALNGMTQGFSSAIEGMIFDSKSLEETIHGLAESMLRAIVNALTQMAAQYVAVQLIQMAFTKTTQASAAAAMTAESQAMVAMAGLNAFAATAAIPVVGPALAPAAADTAIATAEPMAATVAALSLMAAGARADGGPVTSGKPYLVGERGPELFMPNTHGSILPNSKLSGNSNGNVTVNMIEDKRRAGQTQERTNNDGRKEIDVFVADILGDGPRAKAVQKAFGLSRRGY